MKAAYSWIQDSMGIAGGTEIASPANVSRLHGRACPFIRPSNVSPLLLLFSPLSAEADVFYSEWRAQASRRHKANVRGRPNTALRTSTSSERQSIIKMTYLRRRREARNWLVWVDVRNIQILANGLF